LVFAVYFLEVGKLELNIPQLLLDGLLLSLGRCPQNPSLADALGAALADGLEQPWWQITVLLGADSLASALRARIDWSYLC